MGNYLEELAGGNLNLDARPGRGRTFYPYIVTEIYKRKNSDGWFAEIRQVEPKGGQGWITGFLIPDNLNLTLGTVVLVGVDGFNEVGFIMVNGRVVRNYSAEDYEREHKKMVDRQERERQEYLDANREKWIAIESYLSDQSRSRIEYFRTHAEGNFDLDGWGYELVIGQLTDMLVDSNLKETDEIRSSAAYLACSGNQFDIAMALARHILDGGDIAGTVAGLSPLTGKAYY